MSAELRDALEHIASLSLSVPMAHGSPEAFYRNQTMDAIGTAARALAIELSTDDVPECSDGTHHVVQLARNIVAVRPDHGRCDDHCGQFAPCTERRIAVAFLSLIDVALATGSAGPVEGETEP